MEIHDNPWIALAVTRTGGHLGWFEYGPDGGITRWYVKPVLQFLEALIEVRHSYLQSSWARWASRKDARA